jgi:hypothetical protein
MSSRRVVAVAGWDNRQPIDSDVAAQLQLALSNGGYVASAVNVNRLVQATMTAPNAGSNQFIFELVTPSGVLDSAVITYITNAILALDIPTVATITVTSVTLF